MTAKKPYYSLKKLLTLSKIRCYNVKAVGSDKCLSVNDRKSRWQDTKKC